MAWGFGEFVVLPQQRRVLQGGQPRALGARAFDLLLVLLEHPERVVSKDELLSRAWPGLVVEENNLTVQISALRKVLGASAISTVPGRGYQFSAPVQAGALPPRDAGPVVRPAAGSRLPAERSSFIGREDESEALAGLLRAHRLVTLTGPGGVGKTRLALHAGRRCDDVAPDGACFADLSALRDADDLPRAVADAFGVDLGDAPVAGTAGTPEDRLTDALAARRAVLVLDNCEHLLDAAARLADRVLARCAGIVVLATSREALGLDGEQVVPVPPLPLPGGEDDAEVTDAMRLFAARAAQVRPDFVLDDGSRGAVATICRELDGIPLAIEFAAARVAHLSPGEIVGRLSERLRLLAGGRGRGAHQQTLAAALDWSHELLLPGEQALFRRLAVFAGGFELGLADAVCGGDGVAAGSVLEPLASLVAKSLVAAESDGRAPTRYRLLETVRLYAAQKLAAAGEADALRSRHRDAVLAWLEAMPEADRWFDVRTFDRIGRETRNLQVAAAWSEQEDRPDLLARQVVCVWQFCFWSNYYAQALQQVDFVLRNETRLATELRAGCHAARALFGKMALDLPALVRHADRAVGEADRHPGVCLAGGLVLRGHGRAALSGFPGADPQLLSQARQDLHQALDLTASQGLHPWQAMAEVFFGWLEVNAGDFGAAAHRFQRGIETSDRHGLAGWPLLAAWSGLAVTLLVQGQREAAGRAASSFLAQQEAVADSSAWVASLAIELIPALCAAGHFAQADDQLRIGAARMRRSGVPLAPNSFLIMAAGAAFERGDPQRGARLLAAARYLGGADREAMPFRTALGLNLYVHYAAHAKAVLGRDGVQAVREQGAAMSLDEAFEAALEGVGQGPT